MVKYGEDKKLKSLVFLLILFLFYMDRFIYLGGNEYPKSSTLFCLIITLSHFLVLLNTKKINWEKEKFK